MGVVSMYVSFFFSSRRRHTSSLCDWSSDVCSSDLASTRTPTSALAGEGQAGAEVGVRVDALLRRHFEGPARGDDRSEERRVGKECRSRWSWKEEKKK